MIQYTHNITHNINTISLQFRTRALKGIMLHIRGVGVHADRYITVEIYDKIVQVKYNLGEEETVTGSNPTSDGEWHRLGVEFSMNQVSLKIDENLTTSNTTQSITITDLIQNTDDIYIGGVSNSYFIENPSKFSSDTKFKGCMESVRLGGVLLPFYSPQDLGSNPTLEQFTVKTISITEGCIGDRVCDGNPCKSNSTCEDVWNDYMCQCVEGFNGRHCEVNIDDCEGNNCTNGASCVDAIAGYSCRCLPGYTGHR